MKKKTASIVMMLVACVLSLQSKAQLSGTITVPSATYPTLDSVINALNLQGVGGSGATINLTANTAITVPSGGYRLGSTILNASLSASKPLVINGNGNTLVPPPGTGTKDAIFTLKGVDYVTINALNLSDTNSATPAIMEWGYNFVKLNAIAPFDGCQNNVINGCTINLKMINASNTTGIRLAHCLADSTSLLPTTGVVAADANSNNSFTANTITNCVNAFTAIGINNPSFYDYNNRFGGATPALGNTVVVGGNSNLGNGVYIGYDTVFTATNNQFSFSGAQKGAAYFVYPGAGLGKGNLNVSNNSFDVSGIVASGSMQVFYNNATASNGHQDSNAVFKFSGNTVTGSDTFSVAALYVMYNNGANFFADSIYNNTVNNLTWGSVNTSGGTAFLYLFYVSGGIVKNMYVKSNAVTNVIKQGGITAGTTYGYHVNDANAPSGTFTFKNNLLQNVSVNYTLNGMYTSGGSVANGTQVFTHNNNKIDKVSVGGNGVFYGHYCNFGAPGSEVAFDTISNCKVANGSIYAIGQLLTNGSVHDNLALNDTALAGTVYGVYYSTGTADIYNNKIYGLTTTGTGSTYGMYFGGVTGQTNVYNNSIYVYNSSSFLFGMYLTAPAKFNVYHNTIKLNNATGSAGGSTGGSAGGIYYNANLTSLDLRNNIVNVDLVPTGNLVAALMRNTGTAGVVPANLASTSNGNIYYVPNVPNAYIYSDGLTSSAVNKFSISTDPNFNTPCGSYKSFMNPRETASFTENNLSPVGSTLLFAPSGNSVAKTNAVSTTAPAITVDINNVTRANPADVGALQFVGPANDVAPPAISYTPFYGTTYCLAGPTLSATITDASGIDTTSNNRPRLYYRKAAELDSFGVYPANNAASFNGWKYVTASNTTSPFNFTLDYSKLTASITAGDTILYFVVAQDKLPFPNVGSSMVGYNAGYCPNSVNLGVGAGPTVATPTKNRYAILPQPAVPTIAPATSTICQGSFKKLTVSPASSPDTVTLGNAAVYNAYGGGFPTPFGNYYGSSHDQYLIRASELTAFGLTAGPVNALAFNLATGYTYAALQNYTIKMANTANSAMGSSFISTGFTTVYNGTYTPPATTGWAPVTFTTPFNWDGVSNIVVDVSFSNCTVCNGTSSCTTAATTYCGSVYQTSTPFVSALSYRANNNCTIASFAPTGSPAPLSGTYSQRPDMRIIGTQFFNVNWSPVTALYKDSTLTQPMSATDTNSVVYAAPATNTSYTVSNVLGGCNATNSSAPATLTLTAPATTTTPANNASLCGGSNVSVSGPSGTGYSYQWLLNGSNITGATSQNYAATAIGNYTVKVTSSVTGCSATSAPIAVSNVPAPPATVTPAGATTVCSGSTVTMNAPTGAYTYQWTCNGTPLSNATSAGYTANATGNYGVIVSSAPNCSTTSSNVPVLVDTVNIATSSVGSTAICTGNSVTLNGTTAPGRLYQWQLGGNSISGATNPSFVATAAGNYTLVATNSATGCSATSTPAIAVTVGTGPTANFTPSGTAGICAGGGTTTLSIAPISGLSYQWNFNGTPINGATSPSYTANAAGNYTLTVSATPSCYTTSAVTNLVQNPLPNTTTTPAGPNATVCQNSSLPISVPTGPGFTYQWMQGGVIIPGATNNTYGATIAGNYTVAVTNTATGCANTSSNLSVAASSLPTVSASTTGPLTICNGDTTVFNAGTGTGYTYQWQQNGQNIAGGSSASYKAFLPGSYTVVVTNTSNCSITSTPIVLTVNPTPPATINYSTPLEFCEGGAVVLSANQGPNLSYQWLLDGTPIPNAVTASNVANWSGNYTVKVTNGLGCSAVSIPEKVVVHALPHPSIVQNGMTLTTDVYHTYQWYWDGNKLPGAVAQSLTVNKDGGYHVEVTDSFGCQNHSTVLLINTINLGINGPENASAIRIYPNPTQAVIHIDAPEKVNVSILDVTGKTIISKEHASVIDLGQIASGTYMVIVADEDGKVLKAERVVKSE